MIKDYAFVLDSTSLVPEEIQQLARFEFVNLSISIGNENKKDTEWTISEIVEAFNKGLVPHSSCPSPIDFEKFFKKLFKEGYKDLICLPMSSGISGTFQAAKVAIDSLEEEEKAHVHLIDTPLANFGIKALVISLKPLLEKGLSCSKVLDFIQTEKKNSFQLFTIRDLDHLYKGGRLTMVSFMVGKFLRIKPIIEVNHENGALKVVKKARTHEEIDRFFIEAIRKLSETYEHVYLNFIYLTDREPMDHLIEKVKSKFTNIQFDTSDEVGQVFTVHLGRSGYGVCGFGYNSIE